MMTSRSFASTIAPYWPSTGDAGKGQTLEQSGITVELLDESMRVQNVPRLAPLVEYHRRSA